MLNIVSGNEIKKDELSVRDIQDICLEIAHHSPKAHRFFDKTKLKSKYTKQITKMVVELEEAIKSGDTEKVNKIFTKNDGIMQKYSKLRSGINIMTTVHGDQEYIKIEETQGKGNISSLGTLYSKVKQNTRNEASYQKDMTKREKEEEKMNERFEQQDKIREQKIIEANEEKANKNWYLARENADNMADFKKELQEKAVSFDEQVKSQYQDEAAIYREQEKNPYRKEIEDTEEPNL